MIGEEKQYRNYVGYEYKELFTDISKVSQYLDGYENFGWTADENMKQVKQSSIVSIQLKRDRKIMNKVELTRLQRYFEDCMHQIEMLEKSKASRAIAVSIAIGILGTAFMTGATFAAVNEPPIIWLSIILAIPGFAGWILPCFVFKGMLYKRTRVVEPLIEDKYDEIYEICEKGSRLLGKDLKE